LGQSEAPLWTALEEYRAKVRARFHMPGHKGGAGAAGPLVGSLGRGALELDVTELAGLDELHRPTGPIARAQALAAELFGSDLTFFLVNGASAGLVAALLAACPAGAKVILPRHSHRSVVTGLILGDLEPIWIDVSLQPEFDITVGCEPRALLLAIEQAPDEAKAVVLQRPTYEGVIEDIERAVRLAHERDMVVIVDEAHGTHLRFDPQLPPSALEMGADVVVNSLHKTVGGLTQTAMLHVQGSRLDVERVRLALNMMQSTSPSYLLMSSIDLLRRELALEGARMVEDARQAASQVRKLFRERFRLLEARDLLAGYELDYTKVLVLTGSGFRLRDSLARAGVFVEYARPRTVLLIVTHGDGAQDVSQLRQAIYALPDDGEASVPNVPYGRGEVVLSPRRAFEAATREVQLRRAVGEISWAGITLYPPGAYAVLPGQVITEEDVEALLRCLEAGWSAHGILTSGGEPRVRVVRGEDCCPR